jgi:RHH-type rel operon transcriptional repressor/antitoxin RelB
MATQNTTVSFRIPVDKVEALAKLAVLQDRDRSHILNEAVDHYLALNSYHEEHIRAGVQQARKGKTVSNDVAMEHVKGLIEKAKAWRK